MPAALLLAFALAAEAPAAAPAPAGPPGAVAATVPYAVQFDLASKITGRTYKIYVYKPPTPPPAAGYPELTILDGDTAFPIAASQETLGINSGITPALVVSVAYANPIVAQKLRLYDLTEAAPLPAFASLGGPGKPEDYGGAEGFRRFLREELQPVIAGGYRVDPNNQTLAGHSLGGLFVLNVMFAHPNDYRTYVAASPSIWWNDREVLKGEAAFTEAVRSGRASPRVLITSAGLEQSPEGFPVPAAEPKRSEMLQNIKTARMVDNARELADRLKTIPGKSPYVVRFAVFEGETHGSSIPAYTSRAVAFAAQK